MRRILKSDTSREALGAITWNFSGMVASLVSGVLTARVLDPSDRGLLALSLTITSLSFLISSMGSNNAVRTFQPRKPWASFRIYIKLTLTLLLVDVVIVSVIVSLFILRGFSEFSSHMVIIAVLGALTFLSNQLLDIFNALGLISKSALANTMGHFLTMLILVVVFFWLEPLRDLNGVLIGYSLGFLARIILMIFLGKKARINLGPKTPMMGGQLLRSGFRFWGIGLSQTLTFRSDQLVLGLLSDAYNVGIYAVAVTPATLMQVVSNTIGQIAYREAAVDKLTLRRYFMFLSVSFGVTVSYGALMWFASPFLIPIVFGSEYTGSVQIVRILLVAELILCPYLVTVRALAGYNRPLIASASGIVGLLVLLPTLILLVPHQGAPGAALAALVAYAFMLIVVSVGIGVEFKSKVAR